MKQNVHGVSKVCRFLLKKQSKNWFWLVFTKYAKLKPSKIHRYYGKLKMSEIWTLEKINQLITDKVQESLNLEYKSAGALDNTPKNKGEITKDVSAMSNSDGGTIIYGIKEYDEEDKRYLPEKIDAIDQSKITKEWLEQVINSISPKIDSIIITPINVDDENNVVYVVDIPKGETAHQAQDKRYYKRFNFMAEPMHDYEIRDIMSRNKNPKFELSFVIECEKSYSTVFPKIESFQDNKAILGSNKKENKEYALYITAKNIGSVYANFVNAFFYIPSYIIYYEIDENKLINEGGVQYCKVYEDNTVREIVGNVGMYPRYGPARYDPILPGLSRTWEIKLKNLGEIIPRGRFLSIEKLRWTIHADNANPFSGEVFLDTIDLKIKEPPHA